MGEQLKAAGLLLFIENKRLAFDWSINRCYPTNLSDIGNNLLPRITVES